jgi:carbonic anhydrase/acetyltransferase-like protein (isoleucine patch superfamily)
MATIDFINDLFWTFLFLTGLTGNSEINYNPDVQFLDNTESQKKPGIVIDPTADVHPNVYFEGKVNVGPYCQIDAGTIITGNVTIGHHSVIRCNVSLRGNINIGSNVHIFDQVNIESGRPGNYLGSSSVMIPDKAIISDGCIIGHGTIMHGTQLGSGTVIGMRCACDYNTRIGKGVIMANGSATNIDQIIPDNCFVEGVPAVITKEVINNQDRKEWFGLVPSEWVSKMTFKLEEMHTNNRKLTARQKNTNLDIDPTAKIHPTAILEGNIKVGAYSLVGAGTILIGDINIGNYAFIALNDVIKGAVTIGDATHIYDNVVVDGARTPDVEIALKKSLESIAIGSRCWLNNGCAIRGSDIGDEVAIGLAAACDYNTRLGKGSIVANSSTTALNQYIPENCFAEGVPAIIKNRDLTDADRSTYFGLIPSRWVEFAKSDQEKFSTVKEITRNQNIDENAIVHPKAWIEGNVKIGPYTRIDAGTIIIGDVSIGHHTLLRCNVSVRGNTTIGNYTHIYDQVSIAGGRPGRPSVSSTAVAADRMIIGDGCWLNHGCTLVGTSVGDGAAVNIGAACDYNTHLGIGSIIGNCTSTNVDQNIPDNCLVVGVPAIIIKKFITEQDRRSYFGLLPSVWTQYDGKTTESNIKAAKKNVKN